MGISLKSGAFNFAPILKAYFARLPLTKNECNHNNAENISNNSMHNGVCLSQTPIAFAFVARAPTKILLLGNQAK